MAYTDPYEEWKANGRRGPAPGSTPPPPPTPPPPGPPATSATGGAAPPPAPNIPAPYRPPQPGPSAPPPPPPPPPAAQSSPYGDLSGFKTYADWQAANRAGGGGGQSSEIQKWYQSGGNPQATTPAAPGAPPATGAAPAAGGNLNVPPGEDFESWLKRVPSDWDPNSAQTKGAYQTHLYKLNNPNWNQGGSDEDANQKGGWGGSGDPTGMRDWAKKNGMSEDFNRFDNATLVGWEGQKNSGCPPQTPYDAYDGSGCVEKPIDSNKPGGVGGGGGAGGAGGQGGSGGIGGGGAAGGGLDAMTEYWRNLMMQSGSRYTPEAMAKMEGDQFSRARAQEKNQLAMAKQDMAQRGTSRSANQNAAVRQIGVGTGQQIMANNADLAKRKIEADYQDKQAAIKNAQDWVNSMRDYMLRTDMNAIQREQIAAQIRLAQMNISQQTAMMEQQYQNQLALQVAGGGLS